MYQIDNPTAAVALPASTAPGTPGFFTDGSPVGGVPATIVPAEWLNAVQQELINVIDAAGGTPTKNAFTQLATAIQSGKLNRAAADIGVANAYECTFAPAFTALIDGMILSFRAAHANTGACTLKVNGYGPYNIIGQAFQQLQGGEIIVGSEVRVIWSDTFGEFFMLSNAGGSLQTPFGLNYWQAVALGQFTGNQLLAPSGYQKFPGGLILQWGTIPVACTANTNVAYSWTYPIAFPTATLAAFGTAGNQLQGSPVISCEGFYSTLLSGFAHSTDSITRNFRLFAIGY